MAGFEYSADQLVESIMKATTAGNPEAAQGLSTLLAIHYPAEFERFRLAVQLAQLLKVGTE